MSLRIVFDTNVVLSALIFRAGQLGWLRGHWSSQTVQPLASTETISELLRALQYPKFRLAATEINDLLGDYLPYVEAVPVTSSRITLQCRDVDDQKFIELAVCGRADVLVTGDHALLAMASSVAFAIETPANYQDRQKRNAQ